jgi:hypothetical protein
VQVGSFRGDLMKTVIVKRFFHELFGEETTRLDLLSIITASVLGTLLVFWLDFTHLIELSIPILVIVLLLMADILGGVVANMTKGTQLYYKERPTFRQIFILIHIQPIIFALLIKSFVIESIFLYLYVVLAATLINAIRHLPQHKGVAAFMFMMGALLLILIGMNMPPYVLIFFLFFMMKIILSFSVSHTHARKIQ